MCATSTVQPYDADKDLQDLWTEEELDALEANNFI